MADSGIRCSAAERDAVADKLQAHAGAERISGAELSSRLERVRAAVTRGDLAVLLADLPAFASAPVAAHQLRVSASERETVVTALGEAYLDGRLTRTEYDERLHVTLLSATRENLEHVLGDLPARPAPVPGALPASTHRMERVIPSLAFTAIIVAITVALAIASLLIAEGISVSGRSSRPAPVPGSSSVLSCAALAPDLAGYVAWQQANPSSWAVPSSLANDFMAATASAGNGVGAGVLSTGNASSLPGDAALFRYDMLNGGRSVIAADLSQLDTDCGGNGG